MSVHHALFVGPGYTPPFAACLLFLFGLLSLVCTLSFHQSFLLLDTALGSALWCLAPFLFYPLSLWKTLCPPVLKFRSEGETSWQHFLGLLPLHLDVAKTPSSGRSSPAVLDKWSRLCLFCTKQQKNWQWQISISFKNIVKTVLLFTIFLNSVYL